METELETLSLPVSANSQPVERGCLPNDSTLVPVSSLNTSFVSVHTAPEAQTAADTSCLFPSPLQTSQPPPSENLRRTGAINRVFRAPGTAATGLNHHCRQLEADLELPDSVIHSVWQAAWPDLPLSPVTFWEWVSRVVSVVEHLHTTSSTKPTFCDVAMLLFPGIDGGSAQVALVSRVIIVAVCSLTALARVSAMPPQLAGENPEILTVGIVNMGDPVQSQICYPLTEIFTSIRGLTRAASRPETTTSAPDQIQTDLVDYGFFCRMGIRIKFVTTMIDHLHFDVARKELWVFKSPSICLASLRGPAITSIIGEELCNSTSYPTIFEETLLSIRLLFSSSKKSRDAFQKTALRGAQEGAGPFFDQLLLPLHPNSMQPEGSGVRAWRTILPLFRPRSTVQRYFDRCYFQDYRLNEELWEKIQSDKTCSASAQFPVFGDRLRVLQAFINPQSVDGFWELVRGRRNWAETVKFRVSLVAIALTVIGIVIPLVVTKATK